MNCSCGKPATIQIKEADGREYWLCVDCDLKVEQSRALEFQRDLQTLNLVAGAFEAMSGLPRGSVPRMRTPMVQTIPVGVPQTVSNNSIQVGQMYGSAIQQGSPGAVQEVRSSTKVTREPAAELVAAIIEAIGRLPIADDQRSELLATAGAAKLLANSKEPNESLLAGCLTAIKDRLQTAAADATVAGVTLMAQPIIDRIMAWLGYTP